MTNHYEQHNKAGIQSEDTEQALYETPAKEPVLTDEQIEEIQSQIKNDKVKGLIQQIVGVLSAAALFLGTLNIEFQWLTTDSINAFALFIGAGASFLITAYTTYKNSFAWKKGQEQNRAIREQQQLGKK